RFTRASLHPVGARKGKMNLHQWLCRTHHVLFAVITAGCLRSPWIATAQINSWNSPSSGHWEDLSWSLGIRPAANQSVMITNGGFKAVGIFPTTPINFPGAMTVSNLMVSGSSNSQNTLLLNYAGTAVPLNVISNCTIGTNGLLLSLHSGLRIGG